MIKYNYKLFIVIITILSFSCNDNNGRIERSDKLSNNKIWVEAMDCFTGNLWLLSMLRHNKNTEYYIRDGMIDTLIFEFKKDNTIFVNNKYSGNWYLDAQIISDTIISCFINMDMSKSEFSDFLKIPKEDLVFTVHGNKTRLHFKSKKGYWRMVFKPYFPQQNPP